MRPADPTLPSITFVLSQAPQAASTSRNSKRRGKFGVRHSKSSPSIVPHPPRYPPQLDNQFLKVNRILSRRPFPCSAQLSPLFAPLNTNSNASFCLSFLHCRSKDPDHFCDSREKTVDYRFTNPPHAPSRSSFALVSTNYSPGHLRKS